MKKSVRGASLDFEKIWSLPLATQLNGVLVESFCLDASGLLVYRSGEDGSSDTLLPFAVYGWDADSILLDRLQWSINAKLNTPLTPQSFASLYSKGIPRISELYASKESQTAEEALLLSAIDAHSEAEPDVRDEIELELRNFGVFPFESIDHLSPKYFEVIGHSVSKGQVVSPGWLTRHSVLVKAKTM